MNRYYFSKKQNRIEMYLRSLKEQVVNIPKANTYLKISENELIHTENSHKFSISQLESLFEKIGFNILQIWLDPKKYFGIFLVKKF